MASGSNLGGKGSRGVVNLRFNQDQGSTLNRLKIGSVRWSSNARFFVPQGASFVAWKMD